jgi:hypothetical protein
LKKRTKESDEVADNIFGEYDCRIKEKINLVQSKKLKLRIAA